MCSEASYIVHLACLSIPSFSDALLGFILTHLVRRISQQQLTHMHTPYLLGALAALAATAVGAPAEHIKKRESRTSAPSGCLTVGSDGTYSTIGDALDALGSSTSSACIYVASGTYEEQLTIDYAGNLTLYGETTDTSTYKDNVVTITHTISSSDAGSLDKSATVNVVSDGFSMYNINVENGYGEGAQAVA